MQAIHPLLAFVASDVWVFFIVLIFMGTALGLVLAGGHLLEVCLGREIGDDRPHRPRSGRCGSPSMSCKQSHMLVSTAPGSSEPWSSLLM